MEIEKIIVLSCFHPLKLDEKHWLLREEEYLFSFKTLIKEYKNNLFFIDNSIDSILDLKNKELRDLLSIREFPVIYDNNFLNKDLYSSNNNEGFIKLIDGFYSKNKDFKKVIIVNGRILNTEFIIDLILRKYHKEENLFFKIDSENISTDIFLISSDYLKKLIDSLKLNSEKCLQKNFNLFVNKNNLKNISTNLRLIKLLHTDHDDYLKTKLEYIK